MSTRIVSKKFITENLTWIVTATLILSSVAAYFIFPSFQEFIKEAFDVLTSGNKDRITNWVEQFGFWGPLVIALLMIVQMFTIVVNSVLLILIAILAYGPIWGSLIGLGAVIIASTAGYFLGRSIGEQTMKRIMGEKALNKVYDKVDKYGIWAVIIFRISPFLSNDALSFVAGFIRMNYFKFMLATIAGISPLIIMIAWLGEDYDRLKSGLIWISAISIGGLIAYILYEQWKKKHKASKSSTSSAN